MTDSGHKAVEALVTSGKVTIDETASEGLFMFKWWDEDGDEG